MTTEPTNVNTSGYQVWPSWSDLPGHTYGNAWARLPCYCWPRPWKC